MMYNNWGGYGMGYGFGFGWIFMIIFWGLIIWGIIALIRGLNHGGCCGNPGHDGQKNIPTGKMSAMGILDERYAKGEINKEEYEEKKKDLSK